MLRYRAGDAAAFEVLYRRHKGPLYRYLLRQCGEAGSAEELFQEVWMKLIGARERYQVKARFKTFLYHMARNRLVDHYRRRAPGNGPSHHRSDGPALDQLPGADCERPERRAQSQQQYERLLELIGELPAPQREAFLLREEAGLEVDEIAQVTGVGRETAKSRLRYALQRLRAGLGETS